MDRSGWKVVVYHKALLRVCRRRRRHRRSLPASLLLLRNVPIVVILQDPLNWRCLEVNMLHLVGNSLSSQLLLDGGDSVVCVFALQDVAHAFVIVTALLRTVM